MSNNTVVSTYDFSVQQKHPDARYLQMGNYIVFVDKYHKTKMYTLMSHDGDDLTQTWHAEDIGLDLLNEAADKWDYTGESHGIDWYFNNLVLKDTGWSIGINEISNLTRGLKFDGQSDTQLKRLGDIANQFDGAEIDFEVALDGSRVTKQVVNIYKKVGNPMTQQRFIDAVNLKSLQSSGSIEDLCTAMIGYGSQPDIKDGENAEDVPPIDFADLSYDDGQFFSPKGDKAVYDRLNHLVWSRYSGFDTTNQNETKGYITGIYNYETKDPNELLNRTITQLKKRNAPSETYEANLLDINADIGDEVQIAHNQYNPPIYLSARVESVTNCYTANGRDTGVLGDYRKLESDIDPRIKEMLNALENQIKSHYMWIRYAEDDKGKGMTSVPTVGTKYIAILANKPTAIPSDDPADYAGHWQLIKGSDGKDGIPGATGADGKTSYTHFAYANNVSGTADFSLDDPTGRSYMGVYSDFTKADSNNPNDYVWSYTRGETGPEGMQGAQGPQGDIGIPGKPGADGKTSYTHVAYADNDGGGGFSQNPTNKAYMGWYSDFTQADSTDVARYAWSLIKGSDGLDGAQGIPGPKGADGKTPYTHIAYADTATGGGLSQLPDGKKYIGMYVDFTENDSSDPQKYAWSLIKGADGKDGTPGKDGIAGKDGIGIKSTNVTYQASSNGTNAPTGAWMANVPKVPAGQYLWTRTIWTYTDNTDETSYSVAYIAKDGNSGKDGIAGKDGVGIKSTKITYATSISGTVTPTTGWVTNPPAVSPGQFMWTKTVWNYTDNSSETGYSVAQAGKTGATGPVGKDGIAGKDGVGIKSTAIAYTQSTNGTAPPTTGWTAGVPTLIKGQYLWTKTVWTYTDSSAETGYTVSYNAKDGNSGKDGIAGKDGVGIKSTVIEYVGAVSGTSKPTSGWSTTIPTVPAGQYLWTRTTWKYTDGTSEQGFTNALMGRTGPKGDTGAQGLQGLQGATGNQGIQGPKGLDGKSSYTHIAYGTSNSGAGFTQTPSTSTTYIGMYVDQTATDSTNPSSYKWSLIKGANGAQGTPGAKGADGKTPYFHTAWATSADGRAGFSTTDSANKSYLGTYTDFTVADSTDATKYAWSLIKGRDGVDGANGAPGKPGTDGRTPYFHQAWAGSKDGKTNFSTTDPTNRGYLGTYTDFTQADSTDPTKYYWVELVGAIEIGGTNLYVDTRDFDNPDIWSFYNTWHKSADKFNGLTVMEANVDWFGLGQDVEAKKGEEYTFSLYARYESGTGKSNMYFILNGSTALISQATVQVSLNETWQRISATFTVLADGTIHPRIERTADNANTLLVAGFKLERGNKATDWSPAPEDTQKQIDAVNQGLLDTNSKIAAVTKVDAQATAPTNPKKGDQWWVKDANGEINAFKIWNGTQWAPSTITQSLLVIKELNAVNVNGSVINGSKFTNAFTFKSTLDVTYTGVTTIADGAVKITYKIPSTNEIGTTQITAEGYKQELFNSSGSRTGLSMLSPNSLQLETNGVGGFLTPDDLIRIGPESWSNSDAGGTYTIAFERRWGRVWVTGELLLPASSFGNYHTLFTIKTPGLRPKKNRWFVGMLTGSAPIAGEIEMRPNGEFVVIGSPKGGRHTFEGVSYSLGNE
ncbi:phage tail spike protein [Latilactobacillus curvatus]